MRARKGHPPMFNPLTPYNDLPLLCPQAGKLETIPVLRACASARASLARLDATAALLPNQDILTRTIPLMEAQASSEIENVVTTNDELFRKDSLSDLDIDRLPPAEKEAFGYREGIYQGSRMLRTRPVCTNLAVDLCRLLKADSRIEIRKIPGCTLRETGTGRIVYTPPVGEERLRVFLADWERFLNEGGAGLDPLVRMAAGHGQFESIHPFADGNGRTGRMLCVLFLMQEGLLHQPILYLSGTILREKAAYYRVLHDVHATGDFGPLLLYFMDIVRRTADETTERIRSIVRLMGETKAAVRALGGRLCSQELLDTLFKLPYCRIRNLVEAGVAQQQTAGRYLHALAAAGILREIRTGRDKLFFNHRLFDVLCGGVADWVPFPPPSPVTPPASSRSP